MIIITFHQIRCSKQGDDHVDTEKHLVGVGPVCAHMNFGFFGPTSKY